MSAPPGPRGRLLSGNLAAYEADRLGFLLDARDQYGGLVAFDRRTTIVNDAGLAREVLRDDSLVVRESFLQRRLNSAEIRQALVMRRLLNPSLRRARIAGVMSTAQAATAALLASDPSARPGTTVLADPVSALETVTARTIAAHYFGPDQDRLPEPVGALLDALSEVIGNPFAPPASWPTRARRRIRRTHAHLQALVTELLARRLAAPRQYADAAAEIAASAEEAGIASDRVADLLIGSLLAAHRVPAAAAAWAFMLLADHPEVQASLQHDAARFDADVVEGHGAAAADYPRALAVVLEALRLYPPTWVLSRFATRPVELGGYSFGTGQHFLVSPYVLHRDERNFRAATGFVPDRWTETAQPRATYLPYGHGLHGCPGSDLATSMLVAIILTVVGRCQVRRGPGAVSADARTTLLPAGLTLRLSSGGGVLALLAGGGAEPLPRRLA